jgi:hypothetical protein
VDTLSAAPGSAREHNEDAERVYRWQLRLLPLIVRVLIGVTGFFFLVSLVQVGYLHWRIERDIPVDLAEPFKLLNVAGVEPADRREASALMINAVLEATALERRHHQGRVLLMARVWTTYLGFVTGMALSVLGAAFILGRVQGPGGNAKMELGAIKAELATAAPGLVLVFFGVVLMIAALIVHPMITVNDGAVYLRGMPQPVNATETKPPLALPSAYAASGLRRE